ncbi:MAG TPA: helix-turn-helix domain-containing protein [Schlesneria sp.]
MVKKYVVRLSVAERTELCEVVKKLKGTSQKVKRSQILLKADAGGPNWTDERIAEAFVCRTRTVERLRRRLVEQGFEDALHGRKRQTPPVKRMLNGKQEAKIIATRLGSPPKGFANWSLRLLAQQVVVLEIAPTISYETVRRVLKKRHDAA